MIKLKAVKCPIEEQETTIQISREGKVIRLFTSDNVRITKMQKLINAPNTLWKLARTTYDRDGNPTGYFFICSDKKMLTLRPAKKEVSEERKQAAREAFAKNVLKK